MRVIGRIFYGIAAALGLLSLGVEWRTPQQQARRVFPRPQLHTGLLVAMWAGMLALVGKVMEDAGQRALTTAGTRTMRIAGTRFGAYQRKRAKTLRSDYDLGDQYMELAANAWPPATSR
jgi:hypothetical protein